MLNKPVETIRRVIAWPLLLLLLAGCQTLSEQKAEDCICQDVVTNTAASTTDAANTAISDGAAAAEPATSSPATDKAPAPVNTAQAESNSVDSRLIIGAVEKIQLPEQKISLTARIDTGATTTSINAQNIKKIERDGKKWVRFEIHDEKGKVASLEKRVTRVVNIKRHGTEDQNRFAVKLKLKLGKIEEVIEVTLADRKKFTYPLLIGRNFLTDMAIVDVSKEFTVK